MAIHPTNHPISYFGSVETAHAMTASRLPRRETGDVVTAQLGFDVGMPTMPSAILHAPHFIRMLAFGTMQWIETLNESHPDTPGGKAHCLLSEMGQDTARKEFAFEDAVVHNLKAFAAAIAGTAEYPFTSEEMVHNIEDLEAVTRSAEDRRTVEIAELG